MSTPKFKVGDKVRAKKEEIDLDYKELDGTVKTVSAVHGRCISLKGHQFYFLEERFEAYDEETYPSLFLSEKDWSRLSPEEKERRLQSLVDKANEGKRARRELRTLVPERLEVVNEGSLDSFFRLRPLAPKEKKLTIGGYAVEITLDKVRVGCKRDFDFKTLKDELRDLTNGARAKVGDWEVRRTGIFHTKANGELFWANADELLKELVEFAANNNE